MRSLALAIGLIVGTTPAHASVYTLACKTDSGTRVTYTLDAIRAVATASNMQGSFDLSVEGDIATFFTASEEGKAVNVWDFDLATGAMFHRWRSSIGYENAESVVEMEHDTPQERAANAKAISSFFDGMDKQFVDSRTVCAVKKA